MNALKIFSNDEFGEIRTVEIEGKIYFVGKDVANALGYINPRDAIARHCKGVVKHDSFKEGGQEVALIPEGDMYRLITHSKLESAERFESWVFDEVLPSIRKHGIYATDKVIDDILNNPDFGIELLTKLKEERAARLAAEKKNAILMHVNKTYTMTEIAKELGLKSAIELNKLLAEKKIQYKVNETWVMYSQYSDLGYEEIKQEVLDNGKVIYHRRITQMGREFILNLFDFVA
ncbi:MAG: hypothetical protein ENTA_01472 [Enterocloster clostridioformis]